MDKKDLKAEKIFTQAIHSQKEYNFKVAEKLYKKILKKHPNHIQSINLLGILSLQTENLEQAKQLFDKSLKIIGEELKLEIQSYKSGQKVWDWIIPNSWNVNEAYIEDKS